MKFKNGGTTFRKYGHIVISHGMIGFVKNARAGGKVHTILRYRPRTKTEHEAIARERKWMAEAGITTGRPTSP